MYYTVHYVSDDFVKGREHMRLIRNCVCLINSCGLPTGSVVNAIPDIPLPRGRGARLRKWGGGGGGFAWQYDNIYRPEL